MGDSFTNFLLVTLIALIGFIAKIFFQKLESFERKVNAILVQDMGQAKDIEQHTKDIKDLWAESDIHDKRITQLEKK